jgi:hypothetical protein
VQAAALDKRLAVKTNLKVCCKVMSHGAESKSKSETMENVCNYKIQKASEMYMELKKGDNKSSSPKECFSVCCYEESPKINHIPIPYT